MNLYYSFLVCFLLFACSIKPHSTYEQLKTNRELPCTWDIEMRVNDSLQASIHSLHGTYFSTPYYNLIQPFCGIGSYGLSGGVDNEIQLEDKRILFNSFYIKSCASPEVTNVYFKIALVVDLIDTINYGHFSSEIISRNHPDILGKGSFTVLGKQIEYQALYLYRAKNIALINNRIFHLELGNLILIHVNKSGEIQTKQLKTNENTIDSLVQEITMILAVPANKNFILNGFET